MKKTRCTEEPIVFALKQGDVARSLHHSSSQENQTR
jgi:hypothetical protein